MKKIRIVFNDNTKITYTIKDSVSWVPYWDRHKYRKNSMKSAILQQYPKKDFEAINLLNIESEEN